MWHPEERGQRFTDTSTQRGHPVLRQLKASPQNIFLPNAWSGAGITLIPIGSCAGRSRWISAAEMRGATTRTPRSKASELFSHRVWEKGGPTSHPGAGRWVQHSLHGWECQANVPMAFAELCVLTVPAGAVVTGRGCCCGIPVPGVIPALLCRAKESTAHGEKGARAGWEWG